MNGARGRFGTAAMACAILVAGIGLFGCNSKTATDQGQAGAGGKATAAAGEAEAPVTAYTYPAPVQGTFRDSDQNVPRFDIVDGLAYPSHDGSGTVVWVTAKPIASPLVTASACPMTEARALILLRNSPWAEVTLDAKGKSAYFAAGKPYGGSMREGSAGNPWTSERKASAPDRVSGSFRHRADGAFSFDLPVSSPAVPQVSFGEAQHGSYVDAATPKPSPQGIAEVYRKLHDAAVKKDLKGILQAQGFDAKEIAAIRGLAGIDQDVEAFADRFMDPGTGTDPDVRAGQGHLGAQGVNSKGKKFYNYYYFDACGDRLLLTAVAVNAN
jgi:hypothetical protein